MQALMMGDKMLYDDATSRKANTAIYDTIRHDTVSCVISATTEATYDTAYSALRSTVNSFSADFTDAVYGLTTDEG